MQTVNDYDWEVFNGDLGMVIGIGDEEEALTAEFDGRIVSYPFGELDSLGLAYTTTIHKSQGSAYPPVVIPVAAQHYMMLARNLLYTGVTRGKRLAVIRRAEASPSDVGQGWRKAPMDETAGMAGIGLTGARASALATESQRDYRKKITGK